MEWPAQSHTADKTDGWDLTPGLPISSLGLYRLYLHVNETHGQMSTRSDRTDDQGLDFLRQGSQEITTEDETS